MIQSTVADILYLALNNFAQYKETHPYLDYKVIMPFHDAVYLEVWWEHVDEVVKEVVPYCMEQQAGVPSLGLHLRADIETMFHWGHKVKPDEAIAESLACMLSVKK